jgi:DNA-binding winged helix-turn-helix (wHTH) protein
MPETAEANFPANFRLNDVKTLTSCLDQHHSVVLIGMKRVGVSNFLKFFVNRQKNRRQFFIYVDLNDLIELTLSAFWILILTRLVDNVQKSKLAEAGKRRSRRLFIQSIQLKDDFFTLESIRKILAEITAAGLMPVYFINRFDRLEKTMTPELLSNLISLYDSINHHLAYVLTSYRPLHHLSPKVFHQNHLTTFVRDFYLKPASKADSLTTLNFLEKRYHVKLGRSQKTLLSYLCGGYIQYLQLAVIVLSKLNRIPKTEKQLFDLLAQEEQITFQSEELWSSLTSAEQNVVSQIAKGKVATKLETADNSYLWNTEIVKETNHQISIFSPLFSKYVNSLGISNKSKSEFSKKETSLLSLLKHRINKICDRDMIIDAVWPETKETGITDWAIERLISRVRSKLQARHSKYKILTIHTRGYKLI